MGTYYVFSKLFKTPSEAIQAITRLSYSLGHSDLPLFEECNSFEEFRRVRDELETWAFTNVEETYNGFFFRYCTNSANNELVLNVHKLRNGRLLTRADYFVYSEHSLRSSSIAAVMLGANWQLDPLTYEEQEEQAWLEYSEEQELEQSFTQAVDNGELMMRFSVSFSDGPVPCVLSHCVQVDPKMDLWGLSLCEDLKPAVRRICEDELKRTFVCPESYDYNDSIRQGGEDSWYSKKFREYQAGVRQILAACS